MINILKASAGSGKTFNLAKTYIGILLKSRERYAYRGVLAVTFTNKATAEMKSRILKELSVLSSSPEKSDYYKDFVPSILPDAESLRLKSRSILTDILHDYGAFSVSTIDKFFQQTLKAFSREIGQFSSYQIELDRNSLIHESVDRILDSLTEDDKDLIAWLNDSVSEQLEKGDKLNLEDKLYKMAEKLSSEEHRTLNERYHIDDAVAFSAERLKAVRKECAEIIRTFEESVRQAADTVLQALQSAGVTPEMTYRGFLTKMNDYAMLKKGDPIKAPTEAFVKRALDSSQWFSKSNASCLSLVRDRLEPALESFCALFGTEFKAYLTACLLKSQTFSLGLASEFYKEFDALLKEKNVLGIDDTNTILKRIIDGSDAPFVYEKLGVRYSDFLLDEFQDTSTVQWLNFLPLLRESDSYGNENLIVGDVKQSIYRWRGSEWDLLDTGVAGEFPDADSKSLVENWRSASSIVGFNNDFFNYAASRLDGMSNGNDGKILEIYSDVCQKNCLKDEQEGYVSVRFCGKEDELELVGDAIASVTDRGAGFGDIAVLVRNNKEGGEVASYLIGKGVPVLSDDSLDVKSSLVVRRLVALLKCVDNPDDAINAYLVSELNVAFPDRYHSLVDLCESLLRSLRADDENAFSGEILYIQSFMDTVLEWTSQNGNNLMLFLKYWDENSFKVSSPESEDAVRVITIHKSKGLEFPVVIFPFAETVKISGSCCRWCCPDTEGTGFKLIGQGIYPIEMNKGISQTLFSEDYRKECDRQMVDAINTFYVALTRAGKELHVISATPGEKCRQAVKEGMGYAFEDFSQILYSFVGTEKFERGTRYDFSRMERKSAGNPGLFEAAYPSIPLNPVFPNPDGLDEDLGVGEAGRLKFSAESVDFFGDDGKTGAEASNRLRGIVLHDILSSVESLPDLRPAVDGAIYAGLLTEHEGREAYDMLDSRIKGISSLGWFDSGTSDILNIDNEQTLIGTDGSLNRPDRVIMGKDGSVVVVDYKFGEPKPSYARQVSRYVSLFHQMGYADVRGYLWYVTDDKVVAVCA